MSEGRGHKSWEENGCLIECERISNAKAGFRQLMRTQVSENEAVEAKAGLSTVARPDRLVRAHIPLRSIEFIRPAPSSHLFRRNHS
jgi:hypothetical protein